MRFTRREIIHSCSAVLLLVQSVQSVLHIFEADIFCPNLQARLQVALIGSPKIFTFIGETHTNFQALMQATRRHEEPDQEILSGVFHHWKIMHRLAGFTDERATEQFGRNIEELVRCRSVGGELNVKLHQWLETVNDSLLKKLIGWGIVDGQQGEASKPLIQHVEEWRGVLKAHERSTDYSRKVPNRVRTLIQDCRFVFMRDITRSKVEVYAGKMRDRFTGTTARHYLDAMSAFLNWMQEDQRIMRNPLKDLAKPDRDEEEKGVLTPEQFMHLLRTTFVQDVKVGRSSGPERAVLYLLGGVTGLRRKELLHLTWGNIYLSDDDAFVTVPAKLAKNSKKATQPIERATVAILESLRDQRRPKRTDRVFSCLSQWVNTKDLVRADMERADIPPIDRDGNEICFHSLRNSYISFLANSGTPMKVVQKLARHSDPKLTFNTYARCFDKTERHAVKQLPDVTDFAGQFCLTSCSPYQGAQHRPLMTNSVKKNSQDTQKNAVLADSEIPPRGVEPLSPG